MKTILVDAINGYVNEDGTIFAEMHDLLSSYSNNKIVTTGANDEQFEQFNLGQIEWPVFTLKHNPEKSDPEYYKQLLGKFGLEAGQVVYFEHNKEAVSSAQSTGIKTYYYDHQAQDLEALKSFLDENL